MDTYIEALKNDEDFEDAIKNILIKIFDICFFRKRYSKI